MTTALRFVFGTTEVKALDVLELGLRLWMGYILVSNAGVGTLIPLSDLGLPAHIHTIMQGMWDTGFMMHLVKLTELLAGLSLVLNFYVPLALIALAPVLVNIYGVHVFLFDSYITNGLYMILIALFLAYRHREKYKGLFVRV